MINAIEVTNHLNESEYIELARPEESGFAVLYINGLGPSKANISTTPLATEDGEIFNSSRVEPRYIDMGIEFFNYPKMSIEAIRHKSYRCFTPGQRIIFKVYTDSRICRIEGIVESNEPDIFSEKEGCTVNIKCPYPYFYDASDNEEQITEFSDIDDMFEFPFSNESLEESLIEISRLIIKSRNDIYYNGDIPVGVYITIHTLQGQDELSDILITNRRTGESMTIVLSKIEQIMGSKIQPMDDILINTLVGHKSLYLYRQGRYTNILNSLRAGSDWFKLHRGTNQFVYSMEKGSSYIQFTMMNNKLYEGV